MTNISLKLAILLSALLCSAQDCGPKKKPQPSPMEQKVEVTPPKPDTPKESLDGGASIEKESEDYLKAKEKLKLKDQEGLKDLEQEGKELSEAIVMDAAAKTLKRALASYPYALLVDAGYRFPIDRVDNYERLEQAELPQEWQSRFIAKTLDKKYPAGKGMLINDKVTSMWAAVFKNTNDNEIVVVFRGAQTRPTYITDFTKNAKTVAEHWLGYIPDHFIKAYELAKAIKDKYPQKKLVMTGSSLGGALSLFAGLSLGSKVYAFNALGLNKSELDFINQKNPDAFKNVDEAVTLVTITGDMVSDGSEILPKSFVNSYYGTVLKIPFYDDSWTGYYGSNHHGSDAIVMSLELYLKKKLVPQNKYPPAIKESQLEGMTKDLDADDIRVINDSGQNVRVLVFACTSGSGFGFSTTYCHDSMFVYPHSSFSYVQSLTLLKANSIVPGMSVALSDKPLVAKDLEIGKVQSADIRIPKTEKMSWPNDYFIQNQWLYVTVMNLSKECRAGKEGSYVYLGTPFYSGQWPSTLFSGKNLGWILPKSKENPKAIVISPRSNDICSFEMRGH